MRVGAGLVDFVAATSTVHAGGAFLQALQALTTARTCCYNCARLLLLLLPLLLPASAGASRTRHCSLRTASVRR
jgi:hypothetical protein